MPKESSALVIETWAQAAANVSSHQRDYVIEILKEIRDSEHALHKQKSDHTLEEQKKSEESRPDAAVR
jgi:hypothetical protein